MPHKVEDIFTTENVSKFEIDHGLECWEKC